MAAKKGKCLAGHAPHPDCHLHCCAITVERGAEIRAQARSKTNWAEVTPVRPVCTCGISKLLVCAVHG